MSQKYYIDYSANNGKILGFLTKDTLKLKKEEIIEVDLKTWENGFAFNKIIIDGENISFENVDFRTEEEKNISRINSINEKTESIIITPYPIYKQLNIDNLLNPYTVEMRENKNMFIDTVRNIERIAKENGTQLEDINWAGLDEITEPYQITQDLILQAKNLLGE